jgi:hypothetical protein
VIFGVDTVVVDDVVVTVVVETAGVKLYATVDPPPFPPEDVYPPPELTMTGFGVP